MLGLVAAQRRMHLHLGEECFHSDDIFRDGLAGRKFEISLESDEFEIATDALGFGLHLLAESLRLQGIARTEHALEVAEFSEPLHRRLRPDSLKSRDIVGSVTDEREIIRDALGRDAELLGDRGRIEASPAHGRIRRRRRQLMTGPPTH